jgi:CheY-like chemotaxis protein
MPEKRGPIMLTSTRQEEQGDLLHSAPRVLCVDDAQAGLTLRSRILENLGYKVTALTDARKAAESFQPGSQELAVLDYQMPKMSGAELAAHLRHKCPGLRIILFTGAVYVPQNELKYFDLVIHKLQGIEALLTAIESLLASDDGAPTTSAMRTLSPCEKKKGNNNGKEKTWKQQA